MQFSHGFTVLSWPWSFLAADRTLFKCPKSLPPTFVQCRCSTDLAPLLPKAAVVTMLSFKHYHQPNDFRCILHFKLTCNALAFTYLRYLVMTHSTGWVATILNNPLNCPKTRNDTTYIWTLDWTNLTLRFGCKHDTNSPYRPLHPLDLLSQNTTSDTVINLRDFWKVLILWCY